MRPRCALVSILAFAAYTIDRPARAAIRAP